ncbi:spb1 gene forserine protease-related protein [Bdellovibrio bacteriovorus W]|nr:spb1 gene forserine protease-related protein [Bdellovibrio bacteriovorus W]
MKAYLLLLFSLSLTTLTFAGAPYFKGADVLKNQDVTLSFPSKKDTTVLVFLSATCPCSASHEGVLAELQEQFPDIPFYGIHANADEDTETTKNHFESVKLPFPVLQDNNTVLADKLGALKTPHVFVLDKNGKTIYHGGVTNSHVGPSADKHFLKEVLEDISQNKPPRHKEGRALGCYIQRG